ncbi:MAG: hypothetical protein IJY87_04770 [Bacilli bacterium]|nr:hypothetical protein [Bacilli bacterium]
MINYIDLELLNLNFKGSDKHMSKNIRLLLENDIDTSNYEKEIVVDIEENFINDLSNGISLIIEEKDTDKLLINTVLNKNQVLSLYEYLSERIINYAKSN